MLRREVWNRGRQNHLRRHLQGSSGGNDPQGTRANNAWHKFCRNKSAVVGLIIIGIMLLMGIFAPWISTHDPNKINLLDSYVGPGVNGHIFVADDLGRDLFSRMMHGARMSVVVAFGAAVSLASCWAWFLVSWR